MEHVLSISMIEENFDTLVKGAIELGLPKPKTPQEVADLILTNHYRITKNVAKERQNKFRQFAIDRRTLVLTNSNPINAAYTKLLKVGSSAVS